MRRRDDTEGGPPSLSADPFAVPSETIDEAILAERLKYTAESRWVGPVGVFAAAAVYVLIIREFVPVTDRLSWLLVMTVFSLSTLLANSFQVGPWVRPDGVPLFTHVVHALVGVGWGAALWMTTGHDDTPEFRWITIAVMVAVTSGASSGLSGVNDLGRHVVMSMWIVGGLALVADRHIGLALGIGIFVGLTMVDIRMGARLWTDLIHLRVAARAAADRHLAAAQTDELTSLLNRGGLREYVETVRADAARRDGSAAGASDGNVLVGYFVDLDDFKRINDDFGHLVGDSVLTEISDRLVGSTPPGGAVARLGGDEFFVLVHAEDVESREGFRTCLSDEINRPIEIADGVFIEMTASVGAAETTSGTLDLNALLEESDRAQYEVKHRARSRFETRSHRRRVAATERSHSVDATEQPA
jgi:diguanylate cyclase (GGDEF)-like protein